MLYLALLRGASFRLRFVPGSIARLLECFCSDGECERKPSRVRKGEAGENVSDKRKESRGGREEKRVNKLGIAATRTVTIVSW